MDQAMLWLVQAEMIDADSPRVRLSSGFLYQLLGQKDIALVDYQRVEQVEPQNVEGWLGSGLCYDLKGQTDQAVTDYQHAIAIEPNSYKPYEYLGEFYWSHGHYAEAEEQYQNDVARNSNPSDAYGSLAGVYTAEFKFVEAEEAFRKSLRLKETPLTLNNFGAMLAFQGRDSEASYYYQRAIQLNGNRYTYWLNLGDAQRRLGQLASAKSSYRQGLSLAERQVNVNPGSASSRAYLAYLHARLGLRSRARSEIAQALHSPARDAQVVRCAVETYEALGDRTLALEAAGMATAQALKELDHHPDMADLRRDSRFRLLMGKNN
jgi:tetratricopeptide (TPR) repeat protein